MSLDQQKIKQGKSDKVYNTETMLPFSEIQDDTIIMKDSGLRAVVKVEGLNLDLKNGDEQAIVIEQYKRFLNGLDFPVQILVRNTYLDLSHYLEYMQANVAAIENPILKLQGDNYVSFLDNINMRQGLIYVKEFYVIVPYYSGGGDVEKINRPRYSKILSVLESKDGAEKIVERYRKFVKEKKFLDTRANLVMEGLRGMGVSTSRLTVSVIIPLLFKHYNPIAHSSQSTMEE